MIVKEEHLFSQMSLRIFLHSWLSWTRRTDQTWTKSETTPGCKARIFPNLKFNKSSAPASKVLTQKLQTNVMRRGLSALTVDTKKLQTAVMDPRPPLFNRCPKRKSLHLTMIWRNGKKSSLKIMKKRWAPWLLSLLQLNLMKLRMICVNIFGPNGRSRLNLTLKVKRLNSSSTKSSLTKKTNLRLLDPATR